MSQHHTLFGAEALYLVGTGRFCGALLLLTNHQAFVHLPSKHILELLTDYADYAVSTLKCLPHLPTALLRDGNNFFKIASFLSGDIAILTF